MIRTILFISALSFLIKGNAQTDPSEFVFREVHVRSDSTLTNPPYVFIGVADTIHGFIVESGSLSQIYSEYSNGYTEIHTESSIQNYLLCIQYLNSKSQDVYVYISCSKIIDGIVDIHAGHIVQLEKMDLKKGTYLVDWTNNQSKRFHRKIQKEVGIQKAQFDQKFDSLDRNAKEISLRRAILKNMDPQTEIIVDSLRFYDEKYQNALQELQLLQYEFYANNSRFLGYYETISEKPNFTPIPRMDYKPLTFIVKEKAVRKQRISKKAFSPQRFEDFIRGTDETERKTSELLLNTLKREQD